MVSSVGFVQVVCIYKGQVASSKYTEYFCWLLYQAALPHCCRWVPAPCICIPWLTLVLKTLLSWWVCRVNDIFVCNNLSPGSVKMCIVMPAFVAWFKELVYILQLVFGWQRKGKLNQTNTLIIYTLLWHPTLSAFCVGIAVSFNLRSMYFTDVFLLQWYLMLDTIILSFFLCGCCLVGLPRKLMIKL